MKCRSAHRHYYYVLERVGEGFLASSRPRAVADCRTNDHSWMHDSVTRDGGSVHYLPFGCWFRQVYAIGEPVFFLT